MLRSGSTEAGRVGRFPPAFSYQSFLGTFEDCYFAWPRFAFWRASGGFSGITLWGAITDDDGTELRRAIELLLDSSPQTRWPQRTSLLDASEVVAVAPRAFEVMAEHFATQGPREERPVRQAMIRPRGFTGSVVAGFFQVARPPFDTAVFTSVADAMAWLGTTDRALIADIELLRDTLSHELPDIIALRRVLDADVANVTPASAASQLGMSLRTLQRRLRLAGVTFHEERNRAQLRAAQLRLSQTEDKIAAIAHSVGCSAPQLSALFRRLTGSTPSQYRERTRGALSNPERR